MIAVGVLRPGYRDPEGHRSSGIRGQKTGDYYTPEIEGAIADGITELKRDHRAALTVVAGHCGGAAIAVVIPCGSRDER